MLTPREIAGHVPLLAGRNKIINGCMRVAQRGTGVFAGGVYSIDQHVSFADTQHQQVDAVIFGKDVKALQVTRLNTPGIAYDLFPVELPIIGKKGEFVGKWTYAVDIVPNGWSGDCILGCSFADGMSGNNPVGITVTPVDVNVTDGVAKRVKFQIDMDSATPVVTNKCLRFYLGTPSIPANSSMLVSNAQLEEGTVATDFEQRSQTIEEFLCKRYFERFDYVSEQSISIGQAFSASVATWDVHFQTKRITPTTTLSATVAAISAAGGAAGGTISPYVTDTHLVTIRVVGASGLGSGVATALYANGAAWIELNAEL